MVGTTAKVGSPGPTNVGRALEAQGLMTLLSALADPQVAAERLHAQAEAEARSIAAREAADAVITKAAKAQTEAQAEREALDAAREKFERESAEARKDAEQRNRLLVGRENNAAAREREIENRQKILDVGERNARLAAEALKPYLA